MLVLTRRVEESILIGDGIEIKIVQVRGAGDQAMVRIGITAPPDIRVLRKEVLDEVRRENRTAAAAIATLPTVDLTGFLQHLQQRPTKEIDKNEQKKES